jgi:simple sugar transport system permease protein
LRMITDAPKRVQSWVGDSPILPPLLTFLAIFILLTLFVPNFGTMRTVSSFVSGASISAIVVIGVTLLMIAGEFDLSVGATVAMGGYVFAMLVLDGGSPVLAVILASLVAAAMGFLNGILTVTTRIPSFIVTLGTRSIYRAAVWIASGGIMMQTTAKLSVFDTLNGRLDVLNDVLTGANFRTATLWALLLGIIGQTVLTRTQFGNQVFATGGNPGAALAQGINVKRVKVICFTITGLLAGWAGVLTFSQFKTVFVATGAGIELTAIASAVVGGTMLTGGVGSIVGGLLGVALISALRSGVVLLGLPSDNFEAIVGVTIIAAAILNERIRRRS